MKTKKTAGTSLELALSPHCGPEDIVAPFGARWELERRSLGGEPRNFSRDPDLEDRLRAAIRSGDLDATREASSENRRTGGCTGHMHASEVKRWVSPEFWESAVKITSERHPYEKALSFALFAFRGDRSDRAVFDPHLDDVVRNGTYRGFATYAIDGEPVIDEFILHDSLESDVERIAGRLGLPTPLELPHARLSKRVDDASAAEILSPDQKRVVQKLCAREFDVLGWER